MSLSKKTVIASAITAAMLCGASTAAKADDWWEKINLAGFATTTYQQSNDKVQWQPRVEEPGVAGMPQVLPKYTNGVDENGSLRGTRYGFNISAQVNDFTTINSQLFASQQEGHYALRLDWAVVSFQLTDEVAVRTGKIKFPVGIYNEYVSVGYAMPWIQAPAVIYSPEPYGARAVREAYTGASLLYNAEAGDWVYDIDLFGGQVDFEDALLKNMIGLTAGANWDDTVQFQASHYQGTTYPDLSNPMFMMINEQSNHTTVLSVKADWNDILFVYETSKVELDGVMAGVPTELMYTDSWYSTLGYQIGDFLPHYTYQSLEQGDGDENKISTLGLRWDVASSVAVKFELSRVSTVVGSQGIFLGGLFGVESDVPAGTAGGNLIKPADDVTMYGISVDVIF